MDRSKGTVTAENETKNMIELRIVTLRVRLIRIQIKPLTASVQLIQSWMGSMRNSTEVSIVKLISQ